jgi:PEGA domain
VLLLVIVLGACGGWYFWGVETVIVSSPPDVTVYLDEKELAPTSYGRYVVPHLSRKTHFLKVQRPGFADTIQRLDFPLTSLHEWVNVKLVPRQTRPASR